LSWISDYYNLRQRAAVNYGRAVALSVVPFALIAWALLRHQQTAGVVILFVLWLALVLTKKIISVISALELMAVVISKSFTLVILFVFYFLVLTPFGIFWKRSAKKDTLGLETIRPEDFQRPY
jgi:hypothetical protein